MRAISIVKQVLAERYNVFPKNSAGEAFAPANIALCKYWGKRDSVLNLPVTSSLSVSLLDKGARTKIKLIDSVTDSVRINGKVIEAEASFFARMRDFLDLFRGGANLHFAVESISNIPIAAGLASSSAGFAALIKALDALFGWNLNNSELSILARLGSGSACRSLWNGFVKWHAGDDPDGMDCFAEPLESKWQDLAIGFLIVTKEAKPISSREAMQRTVNTSRFYDKWPVQVDHDLELIEKAINARDFTLLGEVAEANALAMHALMLTATPPVLYSKSETIAQIDKIWQLRSKGEEIYFTQDAGPNLKLLFLRSEAAKMQKLFEGLEVVCPFEGWV